VKKTRGHTNRQKTTRKEQQGDKKGKKKTKGGCNRERGGFTANGGGERPKGGRIRITGGKQAGDLGFQREKNWGELSGGGGETKRPFREEFKQKGGGRGGTLERTGRKKSEK